MHNSDIANGGGGAVNSNENYNLKVGQKIDEKILG
jgi:hypothetical protein